MTPFFSSDGTYAIRSSLLKQASCFAIAILSAILFLPERVASAESSGFAVSISWRLLDNLPNDRFKSEIELRNNGNVALSNDWALYFNSASKLLPESGEPDFKLSHINGDFYVLRPKKARNRLPRVSFVRFRLRVHHGQSMSATRRAGST